MAKLAFLRGRMGGTPTADPASILNALTAAIIVLDRDNCISYVNGAAEQFFEASSAILVGQSIGDLLPLDSPLIMLIGQARETGSPVSEYEVSLHFPKIGEQFVGVDASPIAEEPGSIVVALHQQTIARKIGSQISRQRTVRSVTAMASLLAHEVKNPLSGIRGAAQLLSRNAEDGDRELTSLICDETDRICDLIDRIDVFSDRRPVERSEVNIHQVLKHVRKIAQAGFGRNVRFKEEYDPSLPPVYGHRDQLIQVFLNLIKNACEAAPEVGGEVVLTTAYQHGVRFAVPGTDEVLRLPLVIGIIDNGGGISEEVRANLFDPFLTTKPKGSGLGLALVAKIVSDHGGVIEYDTRPGRTEFRVSLPMPPRRKRKPANTGDRAE
jgi:two-component system nitrogen regulation sensor histidine kinase GlnL